MATQYEAGGPGLATSFDESSDSAESVLEHYGVKGMKWGVRKNRTGHIKPRSVAKKLGKDPIHKKMEISKKEAIRLYNDVNAPKGYGIHYERKQGALLKTYRKAAPKIKRNIRKINNSEAYKGQDLTKNTKLRKQYLDEVSKAVTDQLNASAALHGVNRTRQYRLEFEYDVEKSIYPEAYVRSNEVRGGRRENRQNAREVRRSVKHSDNEAMKVILAWDKKGFITDLNLEGSLKQDAMDAEDILMHYGVKGMKWGVRKKRTPAQVRKAMTERQKTKALKSQQKLENIRAKQEIQREKIKLNELKREANPSKKERKAAEKARVNAARNSGGGNNARTAEYGSTVVNKFLKDQGKMLVRNMAQETIQSMGKQIVYSYTDDYTKAAVKAMSKKKG